MLEELNRVAEEAAGLYKNCEFYPAFCAGGDDNHPSVMVTIKGLQELSDMAKQKPMAGYYYKGYRKYYFYYNGVEYCALSEEEEN